jgi:C4-dicarboxylate-specific signal transduction histidine kinase
MQQHLISECYVSYIVKDEGNLSISSFRGLDMSFIACCLEIKVYWRDAAIHDTKLQ